MFFKKKLNDTDLLVKYVFNIRSDLRADGKPRTGFLKPRNGEKLSMSEITEFQHEEICSHGHRYVDNPSKNRIHVGYVKFEHESILSVGLDTIYDNKPPRHVSVSFPDEPEQRREYAKALSEEVLVNDENTTKKYFATCE